MPLARRLLEQQIRLAPDHAELREIYSRVKRRSQWLSRGLDAPVVASAEAGSGQQEDPGLSDRATCRPMRIFSSGEEPIIKNVGVVFLTVAGVLVGLLALAGFVVAARRNHRHDLGSVSGSWIVEHRVTSGPEG